MLARDTRGPNFQTPPWGLWCTPSSMQPPVLADSSTFHEESQRVAALRCLPPEARQGACGNPLGPENCSAGTPLTRPGSELRMCGLQTCIDFQKARERSHLASSHPCLCFPSSLLLSPSPFPLSILSRSIVPVIYYTVMMLKLISLSFRPVYSTCFQISSLGYF